MAERYQELRAGYGEARYVGAVFVDLDDRGFIHRYV